MAEAGCGGGGGVRLRKLSKETQHTPVGVLPAMKLYLTGGGPRFAQEIPGYVRPRRGGE